MKKPIGFYIENNQVIEISDEMVKNKTIGIFKTDSGDKACLLKNTIWNQYEVIAEFPFYESLSEILEIGSNQTEQ